MRKGGGKGKGSAFERDICKELSWWLSGGKRRDLFWRSAMSGGRATLGFRKGEKHISQGGDISAIDPLGASLTDTFCIELKFYKDLELPALWLGRGKVYRFWQRALADAEKYRKEPMLVAKQNQYETLVFVKADSYLGDADFICWKSEELGIALGRFDDMLKRPFRARPVVQRYRGEKANVRAGNRRPTS